jgi:hypothetical protein
MLAVLLSQAPRLRKKPTYYFIFENSSNFRTMFLKLAPNGIQATALTINYKAVFGFVHEHFMARNRLLSET